MKKIINLTALFFVSYLSGYGQNWKPIGPFNRASAGNGQGAGIIKTIAFHPKYNTSDASIGGAINKTVFIGSPCGGIWISRDNGANWSNSDPLGQYTNLNTDFLPGCGVEDIVIDYNDPTIIYASICSSEYSAGYTLGTKDVVMNNYSPSKGIYRYSPSTGGWVAKKTYPYAENHSVAALTLDPINPTIIYASTSDGILKSTDSGVSWTTVLTNGPEKPFRNIVFDPTNSSNIFACGQDVYKNTVNGWVNISNFSTLIPNNSLTVLVNIAVISETSIYARVFYVPLTGSATEAFYHYNGANWASLNMFSLYKTYHYDRFSMLAKKVGSIEYVFAGSERVNRYKSSTGGWSVISDYGNNMHADIHDIVFSPDETTLWVGHDGGVSSSYSNFYSSPAWTTINHGLNIATIFSFAGAQKNPRLFLTGEVDNGNSYVGNADDKNVNSITWSGYQMGDGGDKMISWDNPNVWYDKMTMYAGSGIYMNTTGSPAYGGSGVTPVFTTSSIDPVPKPIWDPHELREFFGVINPLIMDPNNANVVYRGANILIRSTNKGATSQVIFRKSDCFEKTNFDYFGSIDAIAIAPTNSNYLYVNYNNKYQWSPLFSNHIYKTTNALSTIYKAACPHSTTDGVVCGNWADITPPFTGTIAIKKRSTINSTVVSDKDPNLIWAGFPYNPGLPNFLVWKYDGTTWSDWGQGLPPNISITSLVYEKGSNDGIYAGTDIGGVYYRNKSMNGWISYGIDLPHAYIVQMEINKIENTIRVGTKGRGIWKTNLYCPTGTLVKSNCVNCNSPTDNFWEGEKVFVSSTTLDQDKLIIRGVDFIEMLPGTNIQQSLLDPKGNPNLYYKLYIHGCKPGDGNTD